MWKKRQFLQGKHENHLQKPKMLNKSKSRFNLFDFGEQNQGEIYRRNFNR